MARKSKNSARAEYTKEDWDKLITDNIPAMALIARDYEIIEEMVRGFSISTESGDLYIMESDAGLESWADLAMQHVDARMATMGRVIAYAYMKKQEIADKES
jgi:hypothetical protein